MSSPSSSHSPSTPSRPFSPFSLLPFELVEDIIRATLPLYLRRNTYRDRQDNLLSFCLVSRLFHQISKPLLFAVIRILKGRHPFWLSNHEEEEVDRSSRLLELIVYCPGENFFFDDLRPIFRIQAHITKLVLVAVSGEVDFGVLSQMNRKRSCLGPMPSSESELIKFLLMIGRLVHSSTLQCHDHSDVSFHSSSASRAVLVLRQTYRILDFEFRLTMLSFSSRHLHLRGPS